MGNFASPAVVIVSTINAMEPAMNPETPNRKKLPVLAGCAAVVAIVAWLGLRHEATQSRPLAANETKVAAKTAAADVEAKSGARPNPQRASPPFPLRKPAKPEYAVRDLDTDFKRLKAMSDAGDLDATRALDDAVAHCVNFQIFVDTTLHRARRHLATEADPERRKRLEHRISHITSNAEFCGSDVADYVDQLPALSHLLAESGDADSRIRFLSEGQPRDTLADDFQAQWDAYRTDAKRYLEAEIAAGNDEALLAMGEGYQKAAINGQTTPFEVNPALQYTYEYAYAMLNPPTANVVSILPDGSQQVSSSMESTLTHLESQLTPEQIAAALAEAARLAQCCHK